jgi:hypothetical protein
MTLIGLHVASGTALVGARIGDAISQAVVASANSNVSVGALLTVTIPISATLAPGGTYRVGFYVQTNPLDQGN